MKQIIINKQHQNNENKDQIENMFVPHCPSTAGEISLLGCSPLFPPFDFAGLGAHVGRQQWRESRRCRPSGPCGSSTAGDFGDIGSASQALDCVYLLSGQTTHGVNAGSFLGASSSWPCCPACDGCAVVTRMGRKPGGQTAKEILESPEPYIKYKSKILKCERKM